MAMALNQAIKITIWDNIFTTTTKCYWPFRGNIENKNTIPCVVK